MAAKVYVAGDTFPVRLSDEAAQVLNEVPPGRRSAAVNQAIIQHIGETSNKPDNTLEVWLPILVAEGIRLALRTRQHEHDPAITPELAQAIDRILKEFSEEG